MATFCVATGGQYSKQRMEKKRGAMDAMCRTQIDLYEQQAELEVMARKQQVESEVRTSLGLPEKPVLAEARAERSKQTPTPQGLVPNIEHTSIQAEIDRRVALALEDSRGRSRTPSRPPPQETDSQETIRQYLQAGSPPSSPAAPNVVSFPGPRRA
jgi:hypothetical protein